MDKQVLGWIVAGVACLCSLIYCWRAFCYCTEILEPRTGRKRALVLCLPAGPLLLAGARLLALPELLSYLFLFLTLLLLFFLLFRGALPVFLFSSGIFMFHIMNIRLMLSSVYGMAFQFHSVAERQDSVLKETLTLAAVLVLLVALEVFRRVVDRKSMLLLLENPGQLLFATTSMMLINLYLLILSSVYGTDYSADAALFMLCTSILLFGAFYTSFRHATKMSVLLEYQKRSRSLESELEKSYQNIHELRTAAFTDTLTAVRNRRYGMEKLAEYLRDGRTFCVCFLDIDHLKYVNDHFGHEEGDRYLLSVVRILSGIFIGYPVCRMGGDEFLILLPDIRINQAEALAQAAYEEICRMPLAYRPSISFGTAEAHSGEAAEEVLRRADRSMYECKQTHGKSYSRD